jgi:hypothetical protein
MNIGFDQSLYLQPFDHRGSFQTKMFEAAILRAAATDGFITAAPAEKSGQDNLFEKASAKR